MPIKIFETFTKRQNRLKGVRASDVYRYDTLPEPLRIQIIHIWNDAVGIWYEGPSSSRTIVTVANRRWTEIHDTVSREMGRVALYPQADNPMVACFNFLYRASVNEALDLIDVSFALLYQQRDAHWQWLQENGITLASDDAIAELNYRFQEHAVGYRFEAGKLRRIDSEFMHHEAVQPVITLLTARGFEGPSQEFLTAHEHYRQKRYKEAITEANKAFESTIKTIGSIRRWGLDVNLTASKLIDEVFNRGLITPELQGQFTALRSVLASGLPTLRNRQAGHGQGAVPVEVPEYMAAFALHSAAANILLLVNSHISVP